MDQEKSKSKTHLQKVGEIIGIIAAAIVVLAVVVLAYMGPSAFFLGASDLLIWILFGLGYLFKGACMLIIDLVGS